MNKNFKNGLTFSILVFIVTLLISLILSIYISPGFLLFLIFPPFIIKKRHKDKSNKRLNKVMK
ncbi:MAG: hypothetical protein QXV66_00405 [Candidatus Rehaiarchaeum fermentans]|nr:hypothetical protein [Candidatus Rehaiarchaeum fermentans]